MLQRPNDGRQVVSDNLCAISLFQPQHDQQPHPVPNHRANSYPLVHIRNAQPPNAGIHQHPRHNRSIVPISIGFYNPQHVRTRANIDDRLHRAQVLHQPRSRNLNPTLHPPIITASAQNKRSDDKSLLLFTVFSNPVPRFLRRGAYG